MKNEREGKNRARLCIFYILIDLDYIILHPLITVDAREYIYRDIFPTFLTKKSYGWWITRRRMEIYTKISKSVGHKYREALRTISQTKDHFAGENEVCEISQTSTKGCEITSQQKADSAPLRSWLSSCGVWLPSRRETSREIQSTVQKGCEIIPQQKGDFATLC